MPAPALDLSLPATAAGIGEMLDRLEAFAEAAGLPPALASRLMLVCEELAANIAEHGAPAGARVMTLALRQEGAVLHLTLEDDGPDFDPLSIAPPSLGAALEDRAVGGLGLHFVRTLASDVRHTRLAGRNRLGLTIGQD
ncbi:ATP-binding protein [Roseomonas aerophila]|uniref:ATP-binding protein n=1 Tax=Teichococcus aerophilus TaxID=1224513 RepID=A0ABR7RNU0_9PROT|nr:ATP-binding protein [Pseudoroseomonas aerophila]MBC9208043.1 ATP-binding protein [Pseudoroseomonas aerophila]